MYGKSCDDVQPLLSDHTSCFFCDPILSVFFEGIGFLMMSHIYKLSDLKYGRNCHNYRVPNRSFPSGCIVETVLAFGAPGLVAQGLRFKPRVKLTVFCCFQPCKGYRLKTTDLKSWLELSAVS